MYGATMGTLDVLVNGTNVWSLSGDQGDMWNIAQASLASYAGSSVNIEFVGNYGTSYEGDMALDNIVVGECIAIPIYGCTDSTALNYDANANTNAVSIIDASDPCTYFCDPYVGTYGSTDASCYGGSDGTATVTVPNAIGGTTLSNTWLWSNGSSNSTASGLAAGTYTVTVSDAGTGCSTSDSVVVGEATDITVTAIVQATMPGAATGTIDATVSGGAGSYTYSLSNSSGVVVDSTEDASGLGYDIYTLTVTDASGCTGSFTYLVDEVIVPGCTDTAAFNFDPSANQLDSSCIAVELGCIDSVACNFGATANTDDGSCTYPATGFDCSGNCISGQEVVLRLDDSFGDSWNGNTLTVDGVDYTVTSSQNGGDWAEYTICLDVLSCIDVIYTGAPGTSWEYENTWSVTDANGVLVYSGGPGTDPGFSETFGDACPVYGCTDSLACNFNALADTDDGSCLVVYGCTDASAFNYDSTATCNDGCVYAGCTDSIATNYDASATIDDGSCSYGGCMDVLACNFSSTATVDDGSCSYGATPSLENFDAGIGTWINGGWILDASGTPSFATGPSDDMTGGGNYMFIETSTGSTGASYTLTSECLDVSGLNDPCLQFNHHMYGATMGTLDVLVNGTNVWSLSGDQGDQWNYAQVSLSAFVGASVTIEFVGTRGTSFTGDIALDNITVAECAAILGCMDTTACNFNPSATSDDGSCLTVYGCNDTTAFNYDATATCDDGSCIPFIYGCDDFTAANYDANVNTNDGSCVYGVYGCTDTAACNYDALATIDDGTCYTASPGQDCAGNCLAGTSPVVYTAGGWSYENSFTITDCNGTLIAEMTSGANGFNQCIALPAVYTLYLADSFGDSWNGANLNVDGVDYTVTSADNGGDWLSVQVGGACPVYGCIDSLAANYDANADTDDGSCTYGVPGCTDATACNFDATATADDGSCEYTSCAGCTDSLAANYDATALFR
jgi:hypothetical protein